MSSKPDNNSNQTITNRNPITDQFLPAARQGGQQLNQFLAETGGRRFQGQVAAPIDPARQQALDSIVQRLTQSRAGAQRIGQSQLQNAEASARGDFLDPRTNPFAQASADVIQRDATRNFTQNVVPALQSQAIQSGAYGGARDARQNQLTADGFGREVIDAQVRNYNDIYTNERANQLNASQQLGNAVGSTNLIDTLLQGAGAERQGLVQELLNQQRAQFDAQNSLPPGLLQALGIVTGTPVAGTQSQVNSSPGGSRLPGTIQGGLAAFEAGRSLFGPGQQTGGGGRGRGGNAPGPYSSGSRGNEVGGSVGSLAGGVGGSAFGPVGTFLGTLAGGYLGSRIF